MVAPVSAIKALAYHGLRLRTAHDVVTRLAAGETIAVVLSLVEGPEDLVARMAEYGVHAKHHRVPENVDVKAIRAALGLSQAEFAARFCIELDTLRNWEQGRNTPDGRTRTLLKLIETDPEVVDRVLAA